MKKGKSIGLLHRRINALKRLEATYEKFKESKEDKKPWITTRNGKEHIHSGKSYAEECKRMSDEISILKSRIH